jgi:hypothetical protein
MLNSIIASIGLLVVTSPVLAETIRGTWAPAFPPSQEAADYERKNGVTFGVLFSDIAISN